MKKLGFLFVAALAVAAALPASGAPIHATFNGTVAGSSGSFIDVLNDFPVGTTASFDVTFDDSGLALTAPLTDLDLAPVSGSLHIGSHDYLLSAGLVWSYSYLPSQMDKILSYGLQLTGTGPTLGGNASLFGLFLRLTPDLMPFDSSSLSVGFAYPMPSGEYYSYADLAGTFTASRPTSVPEPSVALLLLAGLLLLSYSRRTVRRVERQSR